MALIILVRNIVLAAVLAWLGIEYIPEESRDAPESSPQSALMFGHSCQ
ncbi:MAG: hypothetical protein KDA53_18070 [Hyphomonas sp.]|nr:hypothetical protein [Hyphomonas sp.]